MRDMSELMVHEIYDRAWKFGEIDPLPNAVPLQRLLQVVDEDPDVRLQAIAESEVEGGPYDGGHVIAVQTRDLPLYFMVPPDAIPLLRNHLSQEEYEDLVRRTPKVQRIR
ncbi:MAG: hypothetical protein M3Q29_07130 [Chloroflexota bacterium]|nr:hypothetical protein [Chloroflexota bacterium]